jgi:hypothetical protein
MEQKAHGLEVWMQPPVTLRAPKLFNLRSDPFERSEQEAGDYMRWFVEHAFVLVPARQSWASIGHVPGIFAASAAGQLLDQPGHGEADEPKW